MAKKIINGNLEVTGTINANSDKQVATQEWVGANVNSLITVDANPTNGSTNPVSSGGVFNALGEVREVAEGKCQTFVLSDKFTKIDNGVMYYTDSGVEQTMVPDVFYVYNSTTGEWEDKHSELEAGNYDDIAIVNSSFNSQNNSLVPSFSENQYIIFGDAPGGMTYYLLCVNEYDSEAYSKFFIRPGDIFLVIETDVPDRWYDKGYFYKLETSKVDLNNYVTVGGTETITGSKTFTTNQTFGSTSASIFDIMTFPNSSTNSYTFKRNGNAFEIRCNDVATWYINNDTVYSKKMLPIGTVDIGQNGTRWQHLYLSGNVYLSGTSYYICYSSGAASIAFYVNSTLALSVGASNIYSYANLLPYGTKDLGNGSYLWQHLYLSGNLTNTGSRTVDGLCGKTETATVSSNTVELPYDTISNVTLTSNTTITLQTAPTGCNPEYRAFIYVASGSVTVSLPAHTLILTNDEDNIVINNEDFTLSGPIEVELNLVEYKAVLVNFDK